MNKQELIEKIGNLNKLYGEGRNYVAVDAVSELVEQLDEPQKVVVPQFVADWIRKCKTFKSFALSLSFVLQPSVWEANGLSDECINWLMDANNQELFARAWLDGYEAEEEKRYLVKIIGITNYNSYLNYHKEEDKWTIESRVEIDAIRTEHTRKELEEAGFGEVFNSPLFEIEEVE